MKKNQKIILIILLLAIVFLLINFIRNTIIINNIYNTGLKIFNESKNYHITENIAFSTGYFQKYEIYRKDDYCYYETYYYNDLMKESSEKYENNSFTGTIINYDAIINKNYFPILKRFITIIRTDKKNNCYIIKNLLGVNKYDMNTGLLKVQISSIYNSNIIMTSYDYTFNTVTDENIKIIDE